ncbi:hypothetical protein KVR01_001544 [Diaporthe batatas]|uniref:uncharacterized protein n=1 Tax=Diaporthe batatas TaxID=748121 RepID=UPI001D03D0B2|nr:uncharacterized protein KVR01_001544 [Diaporthe batatas]KAG8168795.1 hypothetical protein KVR01_001544 [Diaporthe batatas]
MDQEQEFGAILATYLPALGAGSMPCQDTDIWVQCVIPKDRECVLTLLDFAKDLLFDLRYGKDPDMQELNMGKVPIIFVVHSMGGLVMKEAYIQGQNDPKYQSIIKAITAITFLATPHRGAALAQTLNRILDSIRINSKQYVAELSRNSLTLQKLNEQFRHIAPLLDIVSFYETMPTRIKSAKVMVLEKESSVLGYPGEVSKALIADHHGVCKYEGPQDPNYIAIRNVLKSLVGRIIAKENAQQPEVSERRAGLELKSMLALSELPELDYIFFRDQWTDDTNNWIKKDKTYLQWRGAQGELSVLWLNGGAATGKSVLASTIINSLVQGGYRCQYFFVRHEDRKKRTMGFLLRSLAFQIAQALPELTSQLIELKDEGIDFEIVDAKIIWNRIFKATIFKSTWEQPLYWVIDGLDEIESPRGAIRTFLDITSSSPIRLLLSSRHNADVIDALNRRPSNIQFSILNIDGHLEDIGIDVCQKLRVPGSIEVKEALEQQIVDKSRNNFLWARLVVERVNQCHTLEDIESILHQIPEGMEALYDRMASAMDNISNPHDRALATKILQTLTCTIRVLSVSEIGHVLGLRAKLGRDQVPEFLDYAADAWSTHLLHSTPVDEETLSTLKRFLTGSWVLTWIHALGAIGHLRVLAQTSKDLYKLARENRQNSTLDIAEQELISSWSVDLLRVMGRYGSLLRRRPDTIYQTIPPFCPKGSSIHQLFGNSEALSIVGNMAEKWDDIFARITVPESFASSIQTAGSNLAVLAAPGNIHLYEASDFRETGCSPIQHGERVDRVQLNNKASLLASYGYHTTRIWNIHTGECILSVNSVESKTRLLAMLFTNNDSTLLVGSDDRRVRTLNLREAVPAWEVIADLEEFGLEQHFTNSASHMALSPDGTMIAVGYRRHPASVWELEGPTHIGHVRRKDDGSMVRELRELVWHPCQPEVLGLTVEGVLFRWAPYEDTYDELSVEASKMAISTDGELLVTGDAHGRVKLFTTEKFSLLCQLSSEEAVFGLAFSPDAKRFYDSRGFHVNAWEPNALVRHAERSGDVDTASEYSMSHASERSSGLPGAVDPITALAGSPTGNLYCYGTQKGVVRLHDIKAGRIATLYASRAKFGIEHIVWSIDGSHICVSDFSKQLLVFNKSANGADTSVYQQIASISMRQLAKGQITQLLFQRVASHILVHTSSQIHTISLSSYSVETSRELGSVTFQWVLHPTNDTLFLGFDVHKITILDWNLVEQVNFEIQWPRGPGDVQIQSSSVRFGQILPSQDNSRLLLHKSTARDRARNMTLFFVSTADLALHVRSDGEAEGISSTIKMHRILPELCHDVSLPLGLVWGDRLIYVSKDFAVCSKGLQWTSESTKSSTLHPRTQRNMRSRALARVGVASDGPHGAAKELFVFPGDWANEQALRLCSLWSIETSLLYPGNGEVVAVRCAALSRG